MADESSPNLFFITNCFCFVPCFSLLASSLFEASKEKRKTSALDRLQKIENHDYPLDTNAVRGIRRFRSRMRLVP